MNQNLKSVLVIAGVIAIYHYFFRSIKPGETVEESKGGLIDDLRNGIDTLTDQVFVGPDVFDVRPNTTVFDGPGRITQGIDANMQIRPMQRTTVLQG